MKPRWMLLSLLLTPVMLAAEMRFWTNTSGQIVEAEMTGVNPARRAVQVRLKDGSTAELPIENLSQPDKDYAKHEWAVMQTAGGGAPAPAQPPVTDPKLPPRFQARATADSRLAKVLECGGLAEVEAVVVKS
ncbi:MAG: y domain 1, partial [Verrucomicrobiota bacterium]